MRLSLLILLLLLISFISACFVSAAGVDINLEKSIFNPGETVQVRVHINGIKLPHELGVSDFYLFDNVGKVILTTQSVIKINNTEYFAYFDLPVVRNSNFSFGLVKLRYFLGSELREDSFLAEFSTNSENFSVAVRPAYFQQLNIEAYDQPSIIFNVRNKGSTANVSFEGDDSFLVPVLSRFQLGAGEQKNAEVKVKVVGKTQAIFSGNVKISYDSFVYNIPVLITRKGVGGAGISGNGTGVNNSVSANNTLNISSGINDSVVGGNVNNTISTKPGAVEYNSLILISPDVKDIKENLDKTQNSTSVGDFVFKNIGNSSLGGIDVTFKSLEDIMSVDKTRIELLPANSEVAVHVLLNSAGAKLSRYRGDFALIASNGVNYSIPFDVFVNLGKGGLQSNKDIINATQQFYSGYNNSAGTTGEESGSFGSWLIVLVVLIILGVVAYYLYTKGKPKQAAYDSLVESFRQRH